MARVLSSNLPAPGCGAPARTATPCEPPDLPQVRARRLALLERFGCAPCGTDLEAPAPEAVARSESTDCPALP